MRTNPPRVELAGLDDEQVRKVVRLALLVVVDLALDKPWDAFGKIEAAFLDTDLKIAFWSLLDSSQRSLIKDLAALAK